MIEAAVPKLAAFYAGEPSTWERVIYACLRRAQSAAQPREALAVR